MQKLLTRYRKIERYARCLFSDRAQKHKKSSNLKKITAFVSGFLLAQKFNYLTLQASQAL